MLSRPDEKKEEKHVREKDRGKAGTAMLDRLSHFWGRKKGGIGARFVKTALKKTTSNLTARRKGPHMGT